jgi:prepilin-type N-terminal cleavage/methylation domain-containing protein
MLLTRTADAPARRPAFTLVELLVVMAIILVLAALTLGAIVGLVGTQQQAVTEDTFRTIDAKLRQHWNYVLKQARDEALQGSAKIMPGVYKLAGAGSPNIQNIEKRAQVIHIKLRLIQAFPESFSELVNPPYLNVKIGGATYNLLPDALYLSTYKGALANINATNHNALTESSACLLMALKVARGSGATTLKDDDLPSRVIDWDNDGIKEIVDSWGTPIRFKRFAMAIGGSTVIADELDGMCPPPAKISTVYTDPNDKTKPLLLHDTLDPFGYLGDFNWYNTPATMPYRQIVEQQLLFGTITGKYSVPYVQSAGSDKTLDDSDDIYSFRLTMGNHGN